MISRLSGAECSALKAARFNADQPETVLAKKAGLKLHTFRYAIRKLLSAGIIERQVWVNIPALGLSEYDLYFSLATDSPASREKALGYIRGSGSVAWFAELGGKYEYQATVCAVSPGEFYTFLQDLTSQHGAAFHEKAVSANVGLNIFSGDWYGKGEKKESVCFLPSRGITTIAETDRLLIETFAKGRHESVRELARELSLPASTVQKRLKRLKEDGIVKAVVYQPCPWAIGLSTFKVLVHTKGLDSGSAEAISSFARQHSAITKYSACVGNWDYELEADFGTPEALVPFKQEFLAASGRYITHIEIMPVFRQGQSAGFPVLRSAGGR